MDATLLVLDGRSQPRPVSREVLERAGYRVVQVFAMRDAIRRASRGPLSALVLKGSGDPRTTLRDIRCLRRHPATARIPILVLDSTGQDLPHESGFSLVGWLREPCPPRRLLEEVQYLTTPERSRPGFLHERIEGPSIGAMGPGSVGPLNRIGERTGAAEWRSARRVP